MRRSVPGTELAVLAVVTILYAMLLTIEQPDFPIYLYPWLEHIEARGVIGAFSEPFSNYTPPYLYLLAAASLLPLSMVVTIKLLAIACLAFLAYAAHRLMKAVGATEPTAALLFVLALPTVIMNGPLLGQCDSLWVGACLMALAAMVERSVIRMALWAGVAFAFKAQAAFFAPIALGLVIKHRAWPALLIPPAVYLAAVTPAWAAGWPLHDLLTVYLKQAELVFQGNAPNLWAIPAQAGLRGFDLAAMIAAGVAAAALVAMATRARLSAHALLLAALVSALVLPFLLPRMHERFFFLADLLALCLAYWRRDRTSIALCALTQAGSALSIIAYLGLLPWLNAAASLFMAAAIVLAIRTLAISLRPPHNHSPAGG